MFERRSLHISHGLYVLWVVGAIGVKVTAFLKTYVNVSYRTRSRRHRIRAHGVLPLAYRPSIPDLFSLYCTEDLVLLFLLILYRRAAVLYAQREPRGILASRVRHQTDRGLHP